MSKSHRALRAFATLLMGAGIGAVGVGGVNLVRDWLTGPLANIVPNVSLPPVLILSGAAMVIGGAVLRRRFSGSALPPVPDTRERALRGD